MAVQIDEVEVMARQPDQPGRAPAAAQGAAASGHGAQSPELEHQVAQTVAILHARDLRLRAD